MNVASEKLLLVVVAKAPVQGEVKTRLCSVLTPAEATQLYCCFLEDRIAEMGALKGMDLAIAYTPENSKSYFEAQTCNGFDLFPQNGNNLGERLNNIFVQKTAEGYDAVVIIDSDTPDLPRSVVVESFEVLTAGRAEAVFGPCHDGGYYLVGLRRPHPEFFADIPWSTADVLQKTLAVAAKNAVVTELLRPWNDLDTVEDLRGYFQQHKHAHLQSGWTGEKTFQHLSRLKSVSGNSPPPK